MTVRTRVLAAALAAAILVVLTLVHKHVLAVVMAVVVVALMIVLAHVHPIAQIPAQIHVLEAALDHVLMIAKVLVQIPA